MNAISPPLEGWPTRPTPYRVGYWATPHICDSPRGPVNGPPSLKALAALVLRSSELGQSVDHLRAEAQNAQPTHGHHVGHPENCRGPVQPAPVSIPHDAAASLDALACFESDPRGVVSWLARQREGQPRHLSPRWVAVIQTEARLRLQEVEG
jgi:hypothetical protein